MLKIMLEAKTCNYAQFYARLKCGSLPNTVLAGQCLEEVDSALSPPQYMYEVAEHHVSDKMNNYKWTVNGQSMFV